MLLPDRDAVSMLQGSCSCTPWLLQCMHSLANGTNWAADLTDSFVAMCRAGGHTTASGVNPCPAGCAASASYDVSRGTSPLARCSPVCIPARCLRQHEPPVPGLAGAGPGAWQRPAAVRAAGPSPAVCPGARQTAAAHGLASNTSGRRHAPGLLGCAEPGRRRCAHKSKRCATRMIAGVLASLGDSSACLLCSAAEENARWAATSLDCQ